MSIREVLSRVLVKPDHTYTYKDEIPNLEDLKNESLAPKLAAWLALAEKKHLAQLAANIQTKTVKREKTREVEQTIGINKNNKAKTKKTIDNRKASKANTIQIDKKGFEIADE